MECRLRSKGRVGRARAPCGGADIPATAPLPGKRPISAGSAAAPAMKRCARGRFITTRCGQQSCPCPTALRLCPGAKAARSYFFTYSSIRNKKVKKKIFLTVKNLGYEINMDIKQEKLWAAIVAKLREMNLGGGKTQTDLGAMLGVPNGTINRWINGGRGAEKKNIETLLRYMRVLGLENPLETQDKYYEVPFVEAVASMGSGSLVDGRRHENTLAFRRDWLARQGNPKNMVVIGAIGGSMEPTIPDGATILVDETESKIRYPTNGHIYFVRKDGELFLKRLKVQQGKVISLISDCDGSEIPVKDSEDFAVLAKAVWFGKEL